MRRSQYGTPTKVFIRKWLAKFLELHVDTVSRELRDYKPETVRAYLQERPDRVRKLFIPAKERKYSPDQQKLLDSVSNDSPLFK